MKRTPPQLLAVALAAAALAGCGATSNHALRVSLAALGTAGTVSTPAPATLTKCRDAHLTASLSPPATMPAPRAMPARSYMAAIYRRGHLVAGVDENSVPLAYFSPLHRQLEGFEIDMLREIARAIFGDPSRIRFKALTTTQRLSAVQGRDGVDVVADAVTITCDRKRQVDFSSVYYNASQRVLVPDNSSARTIHDLGGKRVCATKGSTSIINIAKSTPKVIPYPVAQRTDCLVALQEGKVDAISSDDVILLGFAAQDPNVQLIGPGFSSQPYGMAISKAHADFVRFVNGVMVEMRSNGAWRRIYQRWLPGSTTAPPTPRYLP